MRCFSKSRFSTLLLCTIFAVVGAPAIVEARSVQPAVVASNKPICYVQLPDQAIINLNQLCSMNRPKSNTIDLSIDADGDGIPDQLLAEMEKFHTTMSQASSSKEYMAALESFERRLPYSSQVKQLQTQMRNLQQQLENSPNRQQQREVFRQLDSIQKKIYEDPSYVKVQKEISKVYRKLNS